MTDETVLLFDAGGVLVDWRGTSGLVELTQGRFDAARDLGMTATQVRGLDELRNALAEFDALRPPADNRNPR